MQKGKKFLSDLKLYSDYLKWNDLENRYENWEEACDDIVKMHRNKYGSKLDEYIDFAVQHMKDQAVLASQRTLQYREAQINQHNTRLYNCTTTHMMRNSAFQEIMYLLLSGCGGGVSVLKPFVNNLSKIQKRTLGTKTFIIPDTIEGWADALGVLMSSFFVDKQPFPEYAGYEIKFDYSLIRDKGTYISGGFKAPGPDGLRNSLNKIEDLLNNWLETEGQTIRPILAYDIICHASNSVISGGVRRSALNFIVDSKDDEMLNAKIGNWWESNSQRARSNNSVLLIRDGDEAATKEYFENIVGMNNGMSDIGFMFANSYFEVYNPCLTGDSLITVRDKGNKNKIYQIEIRKLEQMKSNGEILPEVLTMDENTGELTWNNIANAWISKLNAELIELELEDGNSIRLTPDHKVYTENRGWVEAGSLKYDDILISIAYMAVTKIKNRIKSINVIENETVYDLSVENNHNFFANNLLVHNCYEIGMNPINLKYDYESIKYDDIGEFIKTNEHLFGIQGCNLTEINASKAITKDKFLNAVKAATILGTLQAGYTTFPYLGKVTEDIFKQESLLGVSVTGWMNNPKLFNDKLLQEAAEYAKEINREVSELININQAARITTIKPSGNSAVVLGTASGIHPEHSKKYFRVMQLNKESETAKWLHENMEFMLEESVYSETKSDYVVFIPIENPKTGIYKEDISALEHLELIKLVKENWIDYGKNPELSTQKSLSHNVSCTVIVDTYEQSGVVDYIWDNKNVFSAVSFLSKTGDKEYNQAPFTSVLEMEEIIDEYGKGALFASGMIVDGLHYFKGNLWQACDSVLNRDIPISGTREDVLLKRYWISRAKKYARNYFKGDLQKTVNCLKDVHLFHKWEVITRNFRPVDLDKILQKPTYKDIGDYASQACSSGSCEITSF